MTDNEKAATFIGWTPDQPCQHRETIDGAQWGMGVRQCAQCYCRFPLDLAHCKHTQTPPDMTDPRNYMAALEVLPKRDSGWTVESNIYLGDAGVISHIIIVVRGTDWMYVEARHPHFGKAAVEALANLYDRLNPPKETE